MAELRTMAQMIAIAPITEELRHILSPKPVSELNDGLASAISASFRACSREHWKWLAYFVIARMSDTVEIARAYSNASCHDAGLHFLGITASEIAVSEIGFLSSELRSGEADDGTMCCVAANRFEKLALSLGKLRESIRDRKMCISPDIVNRAERELQSAVKQDVLNGSEDLIISAFPVRIDNIGVSLQATRQAAENRARALWKVSRFASKIGLAKEFADTASAVAMAAERHVEYLLSSAERHSIPADGEHLIESGFIQAIRILELTAGPEKASKILNNGLATLRGSSTFAVESAGS